MWAFAILPMFVLLAIWVLNTRDPETSYRLLRVADHLFAPERTVRVPERVRNTKTNRDSRAQTVVDGGTGKYIHLRKRPTNLQSKQLAARQNWRCALCGRRFDDSLWDVDHKVPLFLGGSNDQSNQHCVCRSCHAAKSSREQSSRRFSTHR